MSREVNVMLQTQELTVRYGGTVANNNVSITVGAGEVVGLIGPNGAGKTTFVDAVSGFARCSGTVTLEGQELHKMKVHQRHAHGLARTWQAGELFADLTVEENLTVAARRAGLKSVVNDIFTRQRRAETVDTVLKLLALQGVAELLPAELPLGTQRLVGVGRALVGHTKVLLLDEPAAGLDTHESAIFAHDVRRIAASGVGMLLIDHDMSLVLDVCDHVYVMDFGVVISSGTPTEIQADERVVAAYLGAVDHAVVVDE